MSDPSADPRRNAATARVVHSGTPPSAGAGRERDWYIHEWMLLAFAALDPALRDDLVKAGTRGYAERTSSTVARRTFRAELDTYLTALNEQFALALANEDENATRYLKEERRVVDTHLAGLTNS